MIYMVMDYGIDDRILYVSSLLECIWHLTHYLVYESLPALVKYTSCMFLLEIVDNDDYT